MRHLTIACRIKDYRMDGLAGLARLGPHRDVLCCGCYGLYNKSALHSRGISCQSRIIFALYVSTGLNIIT